MREWSSLCRRLKLMVSLRAALNSRIGNDTKPNVRWPFQVLAAIEPLSQNSVSRYYKPLYDVNGRTYGSRGIREKTTFREDSRAPSRQNQEHPRCQPVFLCPTARRHPPPL